MITKIGSLFHLSTAQTSLVLRIDETGHVRTEYYGGFLPPSQDYDFLIEKTAYPHGTEVVYDEAHPDIVLDSLSLEYGVHGKGDFREPALIIQSTHNQVLDFIYDSDETLDCLPELDGLPTPHHADGGLKIVLVDSVAKLKLELVYGVYADADVISKNVIITNLGTMSVTLDKIMSLQLDIDNRHLNLVTLFGGWGAENHVAKRPLMPGIYVNDSKTGNSSNRHNPFFMLTDQSADADHGLAYGFNLLYSGNHYEMVEATSYQKLRIQVGINPFLFHYELKPDQRFETPVAVMSVSTKGRNGLMQQYHRFVNRHIVRGPWADRERPVVLNNWEATYFDFSEAKLLALIGKAKRLGIELFVLDDGWFGRRKDDTQGLGDYDVNLKKLPHGLDYLADKVNDAGMKFGLWFEPEMVNQSSRLFETHPDWAIQAPDRQPSLGRHQLVLDLSRFEVQAYLIESISKTLDGAHIEYVKWDMNRHITDFHSCAYNQGEIYHRYIQGLYRVLKILTTKYDYVLWEGCASGGNRFDLGMLCYFQQIWTSDNTDAYERLAIQGGTSLGYPLSTVSNHVSASPSHQMLRRTPIETRFHVASFGVLGYELDIRQLDEVESTAVKDQIAYYKAHRRLFQFGDFYQLKSFAKDDFVSWMVKDSTASEAIVGYFIDHQSLLTGRDYLPGLGFLENETYSVSRREYDHRIKLFGGLINQVSPIHLNDNGPIVNWLDKHRSIEQLMKMKKRPPLFVSGAALNHGAVKLLPQWAGTGFNEMVRVLGDYGSELYYIKQEKVPD